MMDKIYAKKSLKFVVGGNVKPASVNVSTPLQIPLQWTRVLRLAGAPKIRPEELFKVVLLFIANVFNCIAIC